MRERLDEIESRYDDLTRQLSQPGVASDPARLRELGKQHAELEEIVAASRAHREAAQQAEEARALARGERDPEMTAYLRAEEADAERRAAALARELEALLVPTDPNDQRDVVVEIRAGTGGQEAALFAAEVLE